jgi:phosphoserine phosphatase
MSFILTLVSSDKDLSAGHLAEIEGYIDLKGIKLSKDPSWLVEHKAADIHVANKPNADQMKEMRILLSGDRIDCFVSPANADQKKLLLADMDSTIVNGETLDDLAEYVGVKNKVSAITERAMRGEIDFKSALEERVAMLRGISEESLTEVLNKTDITKGAEKLVRTMSNNGAKCVLISGGFTFFTENIAEALGFHNSHGNILEIKNGIITGKVIEPIVDKNTKLDLLNKYMDEMGLKKSEVMAIGDGANDLPMLLGAGAGIGYRPKPLLADSIDNCIMYGDLSAALYIQGYGKS